MKYTDDLKTLISLPVDMRFGSDARIEIFGDPDNGSYEWRVVEDGVVKAGSDDGYGIPNVALKDALFWVYG